ncbi:MAG: ATP-binding protein [Lachnospiraceae bacterium]|nr:ATP-binding protein [Lachnospiraceae bacterium]
MKPVNIYALTRISDPDKLELLEKQMSKRRRSLNVKRWETEGLKSLCTELEKVLVSASDLDFYYSFTMPKLGKEFDLLRVNEDSVVNIELKSGNVTEEAIKKQLLKNRYYLAMLGRHMHFYTYISNEKRLLRLTHGMRLVETDFSELALILENQKDCYDGHIEELFKEDKYLISPLSDPGRFLRQEYFLTSQQNDIKRKILRACRTDNDKPLVQGFTGLPGTGKTILLYDIAMQLSFNDSVCILHFGSHEKELAELDLRLKRIDFYYVDSESLERDGITGMKKDYSAILIDEGHRISKEALDAILSYAKALKAPVIFSYDKEDAVSPIERGSYGARFIEAIPGYTRYQLTNRIRMNTELSAFIGLLMCIKGRNHRHDYPSVSLAYSNDPSEAKKILKKYISSRYIYIFDNSLSDTCIPDCEETLRIEAGEATCKEFDNVIMLIDSSFFYDEEGYLRSADTESSKNCFSVKNLFHGLSRAKKKIALLVLDNNTIFSELLNLF